MKMDGSKLFKLRSRWLFDYKDLTPKELEYVLVLERQFYSEVLSRVHQNPRFYLDNLDKLDVFNVSFINYNYKKRRVYK